MMKNRSPWRYMAMLGVALIVIMAGLLSACGQAATPAPVTTTKTVTVTPSPSPSPTPTPTAPKEVFNLKFASSWSKAHEASQNIIKAIIEPLEARSGGRLKITFFGSGELLTSKDMLGGLQKGTVDMALHGFIYDTGTIPEANVTYLPFGVSEKNLVKVWEAGIGEKVGKIYEEKYNTKVLGYGHLENEYIWSTKKPIKTLEDMKGLQIRAPGGAAAKTMEALGGTTVSVPSPETYTALQRGTVDAAFWGASSVIEASAWDVIKYAVKTPVIITITTNLYINLDSWKRLPDDLKQLIQTVVKENDTQRAGVLVPKLAKEHFTLLEGKGMQAYQLPAAEVARWKQATQSVWDWYTAASPLAKELAGILKQYPAD